MNQSTVEKLPRRALILAAYERDHRTCQDCGIVGTPGSRLGCIQVHHIIPRGAGGKNVLANLITLCVACHCRRESQCRQRARSLEQGEWDRHRDGLPPDSWWPTHMTIGRALGVSRATVSTWMKCGRLPRFRTVGELRSYANSEGRVRASPGRRRPG